MTNPFKPRLSRGEAVPAHRPDHSSREPSHGNRVMEHLRGATLSLFRVVVGLLFACHGAATLFGVLGGPNDGAPIPAVGAWPSWWAAMIQLIGGALVLIGLGTRPAALLCSGSMAFAYFTVHQPKGLLPIINDGEPAVMFCWAFLLIAVCGAGPWALDRLFVRQGPRRERRAEPPEPDLPDYEPNRDPDSVPARKFAS